MPRFIKNRSVSKGEVPGSLILIGEQKMKDPRIRIMEYDAEKLEEKEYQSIDEAFEHLWNPSVTWLNIDGIHNKELIESIGKQLDLHPLLMEDIMNTDHRPKYEETDDLIVILLKFVFPSGTHEKLTSEQLAVILGQGFVITFQEQVGTYFNSIRERIRKNKGRIRKAGADYLAHALMDSVIDSYMEVIGKIGEQIENLEEEVISNYSRTTAQKLFRFKTEITFLRKMLLPVREISDKLIRTESELISEDTRKFIGDFNEHVIFSNESVETYLALLNDQMNTYNANLANRANDIMKVLTVFASMFIPLSFIAGVYGMNFKTIPELGWELGYLFFWILIVGILSAFIIYFRRKKWL